MRNKERLDRRLALLLFCLLIAGSASAAPRGGLVTFSNEQQLQAYLREKFDEKEKEEQKERAEAEARQKKWEEMEAKRKAAQQAAAKNKPASSTPVNPTGTLAGSTTPGAIVLIENAATGFRRELTADKDGNYRAGGLAAGSYKVTADGIVKEVSVSLGSSASAVDTVGVIGGGVIDSVPTLDSTTILTDEQIAAVPVARNVTSVALLAPGTVAPAEKSDADAITNVQTVGVDEGGIVKKAGGYLVVLRRGRLFTIKATGKELKAVSSENAYPPGLSPVEDWYDEMLISGNTIVVIGYSYARGGTEIGLFELAPNGRIAYRATYHLRSSDYYSSRNYASRLIGDTLYLYSPLAIFGWESKETKLPGLKRWRNDGKAEFERILPVERLYRSGLGEGDWWSQTLHSVTQCKIAKANFDCRTTAVLGPSSDAFYVSREAVYVWVTEDLLENREIPQAAILRIPLDESAPTSLRVQASPIDQLSFLEKDAYLNVLLGADAGGQRMWAAEGKAGSVALLRVPIADFGGADAVAAAERYRALPFGEDDEYWGLRNRYVGDWLLYGSQYGKAFAYAVRFDRDEDAVRLNLGHDVDRIEAMGADALVVGSARRGLAADSRTKYVSDTVLSSIDLGEGARIAMQYVMPNASQSDDRTHGFFYRPLGADEGVFGLPVESESPESAMIRFLRNRQLRLGAIGELAAKPGPRRDDACKASCYDWYGNARPIFIGDRVYGLMGYELIEGELVDGRIRERRRIDFTPSVPAKK